MTSQEDSNNEKESTDTLEEICENTRVIRSIVNNILEQLREYDSKHDDGNKDNDADTIGWEDFGNNDEMYV